jgi:hypothetical protein
MGWDIIVRVYEFAEVFAVEWQRSGGYQADTGALQLTARLFQLPKDHGAILPTSISKICIRNVVAAAYSLRRAFRLVQG